MPKGTDTTYVNKLHSEFAESRKGIYIKGEDRRRWDIEFGVKHYAGAVIYTVAGFLDKNKDAQQDSLFELMNNSTNCLVKELVKYQDLQAVSTARNHGTNTLSRSSTSSNSLNGMTISPGSTLSRSTGLSSFANQSAMGASNLSLAPSTTGSTTSGIGSIPGSNTSTLSFNTSKGKSTVGDTFRIQLNALIDLLHATNPWYVRCIKPNTAKLPNCYDDHQVLDQLRYLGMLGKNSFAITFFPILSILCSSNHETLLLNLAPFEHVDSRKSTVEQFQE